MNTKILEAAYGRLKFDRNIVFLFFISFSLFEKALKESGFYIIKRKEEVEADWSKFSREIEADFDAFLSSHEFPELEKAVEYIFTSPPNSQTVNKGVITFKRRERPADITNNVYLSILIRRIRNNLFHGGKFTYDPDHDTKLIESSMIILECWAHLNRNVEMILESIE